MLDPTWATAACEGALAFLGASTLAWSIYRAVARKHVAEGKSLGELEFQSKELSTINTTLGRFCTENREEHGKIWTKLDEHNREIALTKQEIARIQPRRRSAGDGL